MTPLVVRSDLSHAWTPLVRYLLLGLFVGGVFSIFALAGWLGAPAAVMLLICGLLGLVLGVFYSIMWALSVGRVTYTVHDGHLTCRLGSRPVWRGQCSDIAGITMGPALGWRQLLFKGWLGPTELVPEGRAIVDTGDERSPDNGEHDLPPILIWGGSRLGIVERQLNDALAICRRDSEVGPPLANS